MKALVLSLLLLLLPSFAFCQNLAEGEKAFDFPEFRECGLVTRYASTKIQPACLTEALNVYFDEDFSVSRRDGYAKYNAANPCGDLKKIRGLWPFNATDGQRYMVIFSSQTMFQTKGAGECDAIPGLNDFNLTAEMECIQDQGRLWCTNGIDTPFYFTGVSTGTFGIDGATTYTGTKIGAFRNRIILADIPESKTRVRLSGEGDGTDWTIKIPGVSTTPASIDISGLNDGNGVTCLMGQYQDAYLIGRKNDLYGLYGLDRRNFELRKISSEIGCKDQRSVREKNNCLLWLSERGEEKMCGTTINRISDTIRPTILEIIQSFGNSRSKTYNSQAEWEAGLYSTQRTGYAPTSTSIDPGFIVPSTWTHVDTEAAQWNAGTYDINIDTSTVNGSISLVYSTVTHSLRSLSDDATTIRDIWTLTGNTSGLTLTIGTGGYVYFIRSSGSGTAAVYASTNTAIVGHFDINLNASTLSSAVTTKGYFVSTSSNTSQTTGYFIRLNYLTGGLYRVVNGAETSLGTWARSGGGGDSYSIDISKTGNIVVKYQTATVIDINEVLVSSYSAKVVVSVTNDASVYGGFSSFIMSGVESGYSASGSWESPVFDTTFSTPIGGPFISEEDVPVGSTVAFTLYQATSTVGEWSQVAVSSDFYRIPFTKRYWKYDADLSTSYSTQTPRIDMASLNATATGYYIADCVDTSGVTSWGNFRPVSVTPYADSVSYFVSSGTSCNQVTRSTANWVSQEANARIALSTAPKLGIMVFLNPVTSSDAVKVSALTAEWNEGSNRPPVASVVHNDRYYLFYTTETQSGVFNDHALVLDSNDKWSRFDNIYAYSATVYDNQIYLGDSRDSGHIFQMSEGTDDDGTDFKFAIKTADIDMANPVEKKLFRRLYLYLKSETIPGQNIDLNVNYYIDGSTTAYSMGAADLSEATESGYFVAKFPVPIELPATFHWISISVDYNGRQGPLGLYGIKLVYRPIEWD